MSLFVRGCLFRSDRNQDDFQAHTSIYRWFHSYSTNLEKLISYPSGFFRLVSFAHWPYALCSMTDCTCVKTHDVQENAQWIFQARLFCSLTLRSVLHDWLHMCKNTWRPRKCPWAGKKFFPRWCPQGWDALRLHGDGLWESCNAIGGVVRLK